VESSRRREGIDFRYAIDRREGELVVLVDEEGRVLDVPAWVVPPSARPGEVLDVVTMWDQGSWVVRCRVDAEASENARSAADERLRRLRERDPGGDVAL
jgi:hypothetical protein